MSKTRKSYDELPDDRKQTWTSTESCTIIPPPKEIMDRLMKNPDEWWEKLRLGIEKRTLG